MPRLDSRMADSLTVLIASHVLALSQITDDEMGSLLNAGGADLADC
jgi:hypothetical protein